VQRNAMEAWKKGQDFQVLLKADPDVGKSLPPDEIEKLFDYNYYLRYVDDIYKRFNL
jgi:adenylosuccinate lyase